MDPRPDDALLGINHNRDALSPPPPPFSEYIAHVYCIYREYMVGAEMDKVYPVRLRKLRGRALASPLQFSGRAG